MKFLTTFNETFFRAVDYYNSIDKKLALRFIDDVDQAQQKIALFPKVGRVVKTYRVLPLKEFPYSFCYYEYPPGELVGLVLHHHKQKEPAIYRPRTN